jgi:hypothetical protein
MLVTMLLVLLLAITWAILSLQVFNMLQFAPNWMEVMGKNLLNHAAPRISIHDVC